MPGLTSRRVNHYLDGVVLPLVQINLILEVQQFTIDAGTGEAVLYQLSPSPS